MLLVIGIMENVKMRSLSVNFFILKINLVAPQHWVGEEHQENMANAD